MVNNNLADYGEVLTSSSTTGSLPRDPYLNQGSGSLLSDTMARYPSTQSLGSSQDHGTCPSCGYCKHCGRSRNGQNFYPYQYPYTYSQSSDNTNSHNQQNLGNDALLRQSFQKS